MQKLTRTKDRFRQSTDDGNKTKLTRPVGMATTWQRERAPVQLSDVLLGKGLLQH